MSERKFNVRILKRESEVYATLRKWQRILGLNDWHIELNISMNPVTCRGEGSDHRRNFMQVSTHWQYMSATIEVDRPQLEDMSTDTPLDKHIVHELVHVLLAEAVRTDNDDDTMHEERVVTLLTKRIMELYVNTKGSYDTDTEADTNSTTYTEDRNEAD